MKKVEVSKKNKTLQIGSIIFTEKELKEVLVPNDNGSDDDLILFGNIKDKEYCIIVRLSNAGRSYFKKDSGEFEINNYGDSIYITLWVPFVTYYNIIKNGKVEYLLKVMENSAVVWGN